MNLKKCQIEKITHGVFLTMTEKLYYRDAYISEFESRVISCEREDERYLAVLEKTAFFISVTVIVLFLCCAFFLLLKSNEAIQASNSESISASPSP